MAAEGIEPVFPETHDWGKAAKFLPGARRGAQETTVRDPDGRPWSLQAPRTS